MRDRLTKRFNLLPDEAEESKFSIDDELITTIQFNPDIELFLNSDPNIAADPEKLYRKIVSALYVTFLKGDIQKIISTYCCGDMWKKWTESERELFISENIKQQEVEKENVPVIFEEREIAASVWVPSSSMGPTVGLPAPPRQC